MVNNPDTIQQITCLENELQARQMSIRQLESLLASQNWMKEHAENARDSIRERLEHIANSLCSQMVNDLRQESPDGISQIDHKELSAWIIAAVGKQIDHLSAGGRGTGDADVESENVELQHKIIRLKESLEREKEAHRKTRQDIKHVQSALDAALATSRDTPEPAADIPDWLSELQLWPKFDQGMTLLQTIAETGMVRRFDVSSAYGNSIGAGRESSFIRRMITRSQERELLTVVTVDSETVGASTQDLVQLSDQGKEACRLLFHLAPVPNEIERLLPCCQTLPRILLVLEAAELLRNAGFTVELAPYPVDVPQSDQSLALALKATFEDKPVFVMVEGKHSAVVEWNRKWQDHYDAIGDRFHVVVASEKIKSRLLSHVHRWVQKNKRGLTLRMTNISKVRGKGRRGNDIWTIRHTLGDSTE
ncbi:MAG: hypothetical protein GY832_13180 [Chloroflexi bacterium]|nr:hypothetical protein [Chloroflexota bacterium]